MSTSLDSLPADRIHASAIHYLINRGNTRAAKVLLSSETSFAYTQGSERFHAEITLRLPEPAYRSYSSAVWFRKILDSRAARGEDVPEDLLDPFPQEKILTSIDEAFKAVLPAEISTVSLSLRASLIEINPEWRQEFTDTLSGGNPTNQGLLFGEDKPLHVWNNLRFRSQTEILVAEAFERVQNPTVLFLPNCMARLGFAHRENREADFLVCYKGRWGILEVDHPFSHPASRKVHDDERARLFKAHGIRMVEHFDAGDCWENADGVVKQFLYLLRE
jgi:hypothetical protein